MIVTRTRRMLPLVIAVTVALLTGAGGAQAAAPPVKLVPDSYLGFEVNATTKANVCTVESKDACQPGTVSAAPGGFDLPEGVAVAAAGSSDIYIADRLNQRIQELTDTGEFVLMFGQEVNATKDTTPGATTVEKDICTAASKSVCKAGTIGAGAGALGYPESVAVDSVTGNIYVADGGNHRVDEYTASGQFLLMIGKDVNATTGGNLCTAASGEICQAGLEAPGSTEGGAFNSVPVSGAPLAVGPAPAHLLYVGDEHRVQEFEASGKFKGEIPLTSISSAPEIYVRTLAVARTTGDVYLTYGSYGGRDNTVREFDPETGAEVSSFVVPPEAGGVVLEVQAIAIDSENRLAVETSEESGPLYSNVGSLYEAANGRLITRFMTEGARHMVFSESGELYTVVSSVIDIGGDEISSYKPVPVAELITKNADCKAGAEAESSDTFDCSLSGEVNPYNVAGTEASFEWGRTCAFGSVTAKQPVATGEALVPVGGAITGLRPNEDFCFQLAGVDQNVQLPEQLTGGTASFSTPLAPPQIVGQPSAAFVTSSSAVLSGQLNPENAATTFRFQYAKACGAGETCSELSSAPGVATTASLESALYGEIGATGEARGLQPATTYRYRLLASDEQLVGGKEVGGAVAGPEGTFTTGPAPVPQAVTGAASAIGATAAAVSGTVDPDGQPAAYAFELGVYAGAATQYGVLFSGSAGASTTPVPESLALTGLQPGTVYAYRISVTSGYGTAHGEAVTFTTAGLPAVLATPTSLAMLPIPSIVFPVEGKPAKRSTVCKRGYRRAQGKCVRSRKTTRAHKRKAAKGGK
jgi:DNA-binding beta-propeller fold protein YncE